jgi:hypothetical protein
MKLPHEDKSTFPGIPLEGHLCSLRCGNQKLYWQVGQLIQACRGLPVRQMLVSDLLPLIINGSWFGPDEKVTIGKVVPHFRRILSVDLLFPVILSADGRVMDGSHRIVAASVKGIGTVDVVQFNQDPMPGYTENLG